MSWHRYVGQIAAWWKQEGDPRRRLAGVFLGLICLTLLFSTAIAQMLTGLFAATVLYDLLKRSPATFHHTPLDLPFAVFILGRILSIATSQDPFHSLSALSIEFVFYFVFYLVTQSTAVHRRLLASILVNTLVVAAVLGSLVGMAKVGLSLVPRAASTTAGTYTLGGFLCPVLAVTLCTWSNDERPRDRLILLLVWLVMCAGIVMTLDRMHWLGMLLAIAGGLVFVPGRFFKGNRHISNRRVAVAVLAFSLLASLAIPAVRIRIAQFGNVRENMSGRDVIWEGAGMLAMQHPLVGFGPRTFEEVFPLFDRLPVRGVSCWHNDYLQVYMESGIAGLIPLLWLAVSVGRLFWKEVRRKGRQAPGHSLVVPLGWGVIVMMIVGGMLDMLNGLLFRILLGLFAVHLQPDSVEADPPVLPARVDAAAASAGLPAG